MESLLANIALVIAKDLINDNKRTDPMTSFLTNDDCDYEAEYFFLQQFQRLKRNDSQPRKNIPIEIDFLEQFGSNEFQKYLHMKKMTFLRIFQHLRHIFTKDKLPSLMPPQTIFSLGIWKLATDEHFEQIAKRFNMPVSDSQTTIRLFWEMIAYNSKEILRFPSKKEYEDKQLKFVKIIPELRKLTNLYGIVAVKRLHIFFVDNEEEVEVIWQIVCDVDKKIMDCSVEIFGDYSFDTTPIGRMLPSFVPKECYFIGDESFPVKQNLMRPYPHPISDSERDFNATLSPFLKLAQGVFELSAKRFNALYDSESKNLAELRKIISTICCLHNLCLHYEDEL